jgi:hypothetical protein
MAITTLVLIVNLKLLHCKPTLEVTILKERQLYPTQMLVTLMTFNKQSTIIQNSSQHFVATNIGDKQLVTK